MRVQLFELPSMCLHVLGLRSFLKAADPLALRQPTTLERFGALQTCHAPPQLLGDVLRDPNSASLPRGHGVGCRAEFHGEVHGPQPQAQACMLCFGSIHTGREVRKPPWLLQGTLASTVEDSNFLLKTSPQDVPLHFEIVARL